MDAAQFITTFLSQPQRITYAQRFLPLQLSLASLSIPTAYQCSHRRCALLIFRHPSSQKEADNLCSRPEFLTRGALALSHSCRPRRFLERPTRPPSSLSRRGAELIPVSSHWSYSTDFSLLLELDTAPIVVGDCAAVLAARGHPSQTLYPI